MNIKLEELIELINTEFNSNIKISPTDDLSSDLGFDSLDFVEIIMAIEQKYQLIIDIKKCEHIKTINDLYEFIIKTEPET